MDKIFLDKILSMITYTIRRKFDSSGDGSSLAMQKRLHRSRRCSSYSDPRRAAAPPSEARQASFLLEGSPLESSLKTAYFPLFGAKGKSKTEAPKSKRRQGF